MLQISGIFPDDTPCSFPLNYVFEDGETFDVVVVGAGVAGCVVAARLALAGEDVLLVEAGDDPTPLSAVPAAAVGLPGSSIDWNYETIPNNKSCLSSRGRACRFPRGKCLGGSTSINNMMYTRGNRQDYDGAAVPGWTWEHLKPYFLRYEGFQNISRLPRSSLPYHNTSGILKVGFFDDPENPWHSRIVEGFRSLGFKYNPDVNAATQIGVSIIPGYVRDGLRMSTACAYLAKPKVKSRLKVAKNTLCTGLIVDHNNVTTGITVVKGLLKTPLSIFARKEVILSAGAIGTPQILMLSGIGHADHLQKMGIPVCAELPVGDNLIDHVLPLIFVSVDDSRKLLKKVFSLLETVGDLAQFLLDMGGPLASIGLNDIVSFWNSKCYWDKKLHNGTGCELPTKFMTHSYVDRGLLTIAKPLVQNVLNLNDDVMDQLAAANSKRSLIIFSLVLLRPFSHGTVRLTSKDPFDHPAIFPNFMADSRDVDEIVRDIKVIQDLVETPHFKSNNAEILHIDFPDCPNKDHTDYWRCYTRHMTLPGYHSVGTCELRKVVDAQLRVLHLQHVRVADISVLPELPRGHPEAIAVAIGEKAADMVLKDNPQRNHKCENINEYHQKDTSSEFPLTSAAVETGRDVTNVATRSLDFSLTG